jgi:hypothetical protein
MRFRRYAKGSIIAFAFDDRGSVGLKHPDGLGLLRTSDGIPRSVVDCRDVADVAMIFACIVEDLDDEDCRKSGVEVQ